MCEWGHCPTNISLRHSANGWRMGSSPHGFPVGWECRTFLWLRPHEVWRNKSLPGPKSGANHLKGLPSLPCCCYNQSFLSPHWPPFAPQLNLHLWQTGQCDWGFCSLGPPTGSGGFVGCSGSMAPPPHSHNPHHCGCERLSARRWLHGSRGSAPSVPCCQRTPRSSPLRHLLSPGCWWSPASAVCSKTKANKDPVRLAVLMFFINILPTNTSYTPFVNVTRTELNS